MILSKIDTSVNIIETQFLKVKSIQVIIDMAFIPYNKRIKEGLKSNTVIDKQGKYVV